MKSFVFALLICLPCLAISQNSEFAGWKFLHSGNSKKAIKFYEKKLKKLHPKAVIEKRNISYFLATANYLQGMNGGKKSHVSFDYATSKFSELSKNNPEVFKYKFRLGLCYAAQNDFDSALPHFKQCVEQFPSHLEANYFNGISLAYSMNNLDTAYFYQTVNNLNAMVLASRDTNSVKMLGESLLSMQNRFRYPVLDNETKVKLNDIVDTKISLFPLEFYGGMYDLDSSAFHVQKTGTYELFGSFKEDDHEKLIPHSLLKPKAKLKDVLNLHSNGIIIGYELEIVKYKRLAVKTQHGFSFDGSERIKLDFYPGNHFTSEHIKLIKDTRHTDQIVISVSFKNGQTEKVILRPNILKNF